MRTYIRFLMVPLVAGLALIGSGLTAAQANGVDDPVFAWGRNNLSQLGDGLTTSNYLPVVSSTISGQRVSAIAAGDDQTCVLADGVVYCWGRNTEGQLGTGDNDNSATAVAVDGALAGKTVTHLTAGWYHTCAIAEGRVYCWGSNDHGQLGNGTPGDSNTPAAVGGELLNKTATAVSASGLHTCAIANGAPYCWGRNSEGQLGDGGYDSSDTPVAVAAGEMAGKTVTAIAPGGYHTCAIADGQAFCWGRNERGELGHGTAGSPEPTPQAVSEGAMAGKTVTALAGGWYHTCAIAGGAVYCWGQNDYGQLGDQTSTDRWVPVAALGDLAGTTATAIATGHHTCVIANGAAMCWGYNAEGQLGRGTSGWGVNHTPVALGASDVLQGRTLAAVAGNGNHVVVLAASKPGSPRNPVATAGDGQVTVGWAAPAWDGGIPITGYKVTSTGGPSCSTTALSCEVTGLTNGVEYQFSIVATNALGDSAAVTVKATPLAPQSPPPIPTAPAPTPGQTAPAAQSVKRPPAKVKHGKSTSLAVKTAQGARVTWKTTTKKICTVKKAKLRAKKKGKCKLVATASAVPGHATLSQRFTVKIT